MPGEDHRFSARQDRMHDHIRRSLVEEGVPEDQADRRAWATVVEKTEEGSTEGGGSGE